MTKESIRYTLSAEMAVPQLAESHSQNAAASNNAKPRKSRTPRVVKRDRKARKSDTDGLCSVGASAGSDISPSRAETFERVSNSDPDTDTPPDRATELAGPSVQPDLDPAPLQQAGENAAATSPALEPTAHEFENETIDWDEAKRRAKAVPETRLQQMTSVLQDNRDAFAVADEHTARGQEALAVALGNLLETARSLLLDPPLVVALCRDAKIKTRKDTFDSPSLPVTKVVLPSLDNKTQSFYAKVVNHGLASGLDRDGFTDLVRSEGAKEIARRESRRVKESKKPRSQESDAEIASRFKRERRPLPLDQVQIPEGVDLALAVIGVVDGKFVVFDLDDAPRRLMAAVRHLDRTGSSMKSCSSD